VAVDAGVGDDGAAPEGSWGSVAPLIGGARQETGVAALDGIVYVLGGFDGDGSITGELAAYDPASDSWELRAPFPEPLHHANFVAAGDALWVVGSLRGLAFSAHGATYRYDPVADEWQGRSSMRAESARGAAGVAVVGDVIYVAGGGYRPGAVADFSSYHSLLDVWKELPDLPAPREHLVAGAVAGRVVVIGGRDGIEGHTARVDIFDPQDETWSEGAPMPTSRGGMAAAVLDGRIYVFGGEGNPMTSSGVFAEVESYHVAADSWKTHTPMTTPRHGTGAAAVGGKIYLPGGADIQAFGAVDTVEAFTP
jgi:N-acetylneuraminic acid mutarotase